MSQKFKEIKPEYEKDPDMMKAHILSGLKNEYSVLHTQLYTYRDVSYDEYKIFIQGFQWTELNGRKLTNSGEVCKGQYENAENMKKDITRLNFVKVYSLAVKRH